MQYSILNNSVRVSVDINAEKAVNAIASNAATLAFTVAKFILDRAVEDTRKVYGEVAAIASSITTKVQSDCTATIKAGTTTQENVAQSLETTYATAKASIQDALIHAAETREAVIAATKIRSTNVIDSRVTQPIAAKVAIASNFLNNRKARLNQAIADYCNVSEVKAKSEEVCPTLLEETPQVIGGALVSSAGVTSIDTVADKPQAIANQKRKTSKSLTKLIKEEVTKHN